MLFDPAGGRDSRVVAELGMTHDGSFGLARRMTEEAIKSGASIVKFQWHIASEETTRSAPSPPYFKNESRFDYFSRTEFSLDQFRELATICHESNVISCVSVFSELSAQRAKEAGFEVIKIPSGEVSNTPLLNVVKEIGLPVIMSSGMSNWRELDQAVEIFGNEYDLCLMQCSSSYPTPPKHVGLNILKELRDRYSLSIGLSDHTLTSATSVAAVVLGASVIEKHFTLSKSLYGPDARFSLEPHEFKALVSDVKFVRESISLPVNKDDITPYEEMRRVFQKSIVANGLISPGDILTADNMRLKKPGNGIPAKSLESLIGRRYSGKANHDDLLIESLIVND